MFYNFDASKLPNIIRTYSASRNTHWSVVEPDNILVYIFDGECIFDIDGNIYNAKSGSVIFIPANTHYFRHPVNDTVCTFLYMHFTLDTEIKCLNNQDALALVQSFKIHFSDTYFEHKSNFNDMQLLICNSTIHDDNKVINDCIFSIMQYIKNQYMESNFIFSILLWRIFSMMMLNTVSLLIDTNGLNFSLGIPREMKDIIFYIKNHYNQNISIDDICKYSFLSKQQLIRKFKKYLHTTPTAYIIDYRLCMAKSMLMTDSSLSIKEIAYEVGFFDQHYFCRIFKKKTGLSPSEYKLKNE